MWDYWNFSSGLTNPEDSMTILKKMTDRIANRGPDASGYWNGYPVILGHRRLSIIELSKVGFNMQSADKRYSIIYNGEIYNHLELRKKLELNGVQLIGGGFSDMKHC